jgi:hypothetical protein
MSVSVAFVFVSSSVSSGLARADHPSKKSNCLQDAQYQSNSDGNRPEDLLRQGRRRNTKVSVLT